MTDEPQGQFPKERTAVITGAGARAGIGWALAKQLGEAGWSVAAMDVRSDGVQQLQEELRAAGHRALGLECDVSSEGSVAAAFAKIDAELPPVVGVANLAGVASPEALLDITAEEFRRVMEINVTGSFLVMRAGAHRMKQVGVGRVINTSSITAFDGGGTFSKGAYATAKAAVLGLSRGGARELGQHGITVNALAPGPVDTEIMGGKLTDERKADMASGIPVGRVGSPEEVAGIIAFLMSEAAGYINGATLQVDGGKYMH